MSNRIADLIVKAYSRKYNIPEEQAREILSPILSKKEKVEELASLLRELEGVGAVLGSMPDEVRPLASTMILREIMSDEDDLRNIIREARKMALQLKLMDTILRSTLAEPSLNQGSEYSQLIDQLRRENEQLRRENEELKRKIEEVIRVIEKREEEKREKEIMKKILSLRKRLVDIEEKILRSIEEIKKRPIETGKSAGSSLEQLSSLLDAYKRIHETITSMFSSSAGSQKVQTQPSETAGEKESMWIEVLKILRDLAKASRSHTVQQQIPEQPVQQSSIEEFKPLPETEEEKEESSKEEKNYILVGGESD